MHKQVRKRLSPFVFVLLFSVWNSRKPAISKHAVFFTTK
ncbi:hypothetical protein B4092_2258 [Bacillus licheniformis]|nr:hypothetical protein B4092_2258 [Bacillus licheniformis]TWJ66755.1 hypothetical protein CHCC5020_2224 [Bacillus licheniformis]TWN49071.1 hypothetical protein CHCC14441_1830 [Bacillus licheniformis]